MSNDIIKNMSDSVRAKAEAYAKAKGITLEEAVAQQMGNELTDADLDSVAGGIALNPVEVNNEYWWGTEENIEYAAN